MVTPVNVLMDWNSGAVTTPSSLSQSPNATVAFLSGPCVYHSSNCKANTTHSDNPDTRCGIGYIVHPADLRSFSSLEHNRMDSISSATINITEVPENARIASINPIGLDSFRSTSMTSSFRLARFASAAACSAFDARSFDAAISRFASRSLRRASCAISTPMITSANTPIVTTTPPVTPRAGHDWDTSASHSSGPDSTNKPETTVKPAKVSPSSSHPSPAICLLIGPFIKRYRGSQDTRKGVPFWIVWLLIFAWVCLAWFVLAVNHAACSIRSTASHAETKSDTSQSRSVTPAAIAGVVRRVR